MSEKGVNKYERLSELICAKLTGRISDDEFVTLDRMLTDDPQCLKYYVNYTTLWAMLDETEGLAGTGEITELAADIYKPRDEEKHRVKATGDKGEGSFINWQLVSIITAAAACLFLILYVNLAGPKDYSVESVVILDQMDAEWETDLALKAGSWLGVDEMLLGLEKGFVKLRFNDDVDVVIEGPAVFRVVDNGLFLGQGRLYSRVSKPGIGFTITTHSVRYVDLGTVFGITAYESGDSELHVFKGKVKVGAGPVGSPKGAKTVRASEAVRYNTEGNKLDSIDMEREGFVSYFDSETGIVMRGHSSIDLADIVGGGNGLGTGIDGAAINPMTARRSGLISGTHKRRNEYRQVFSSPYIDGVFIPNGATEQIISSLGDVFKECPVTSSEFFNNIGFGYREINYGNMLELGAVRSIMIHSNIGITFDLEAIRRLMPESEEVRFKTLVGIEKYPTRPEVSNIDAWVLIDGELRFKKINIKWGAFYPIDIGISENARFLTLAVTDGGDPSERVVDGVTVSEIDSDWGMFASPVLVAE